MNRPELPRVMLRAEELPAFCPNPSMPVWNHHPRVFLEIPAGGTAMCPYCGTRYGVAPDGPAVATGH